MLSKGGMKEWEREAIFGPVISALPWIFSLSHQRHLTATPNHQENPLIPWKRLSPTLCKSQLSWDGIFAFPARVISFSWSSALSWTWKVAVPGYQESLMEERSPVIPEAKVLSPGPLNSLGNKEIPTLHMGYREIIKNLSICTVAPTNFHLWAQNPSTSSSAQCLGNLKITACARKW